MWETDAVMRCAWWSWGSNVESLLNLKHGARHRESSLTFLRTVGFAGNDIGLISVNDLLPEFH